MTFFANKRGVVTMSCFKGGLMRCLVFVAVLAAMWAPAPAAALPVVSLDVDTATPAEVGSTIELTLRASGMPDFDNVQVILTYDTDLVSYTGGVFNPGFGLTSDQLAFAQANEPGASGDLSTPPITGGVFTFLGAPFLSGDLDVVTLSFTALAPGLADFLAVGFSNRMFTVGDGLGGSDLVLDAQLSNSVLIVDPTSGGGTVVPLPAPFALMLAGIGGLAGLRRMRRRA